ncbi:hypothetical protein ACWEQV_12650 [Rhodococcus aetherivorans]
MRRKNKFDGRVPAELIDFRLWCERRRFAGFESGVFDDWCEARAEWSAVHGWPGGADMRESEEITAAGSVPDEPWDESKI